jgi:uncharacterized RDD family membrane protein YckC
MKCPKCGYLGFETGDRCRNCGYDFSLAVPVAEAARELPLNVRDGSVAPMADLDLTGPEMRDHRRALDLDRLIGGNPTPTDMTVKVDERRGSPTLVTNTVASGAPPVASAPPAVRQAVTSTSREGLPLFAPPSSEADDTPLITKPRPVRPPLSVRRATPDVPRLRPRPFRPRSDESPLNLQTDDIDRIPDGDDESGMDVAAPLRKTLPNEAKAGLVARVGAMVIDMAVVGGIDAAIVYLTLAMTGLGNVVDLTAPAIAAPLGAFLLLLNGAYLVAFTAAGGQTIGKMLTGIKVVGEDGRRVAITAAVLRALGCLASFLTAGLGYIPALFTSDARALQDRIAGTRVVRCR